MSPKRVYKSTRPPVACGLDDNVFFANCLQVALPFNTGFSFSQALIILIQQIITKLQQLICKRGNARVAAIIVLVCIEGDLPYVMTEILSVLVFHLPHLLLNRREIHWLLDNIKVVRRFFL
ncbi:hypothetical protein AQUCO_04500217v1 [Aquilegia coerulea]|uniref:Uncharacterized protein n=1 Tax=Aquilegia coerulea TaxID=218851 RepID=A0A2G5CME2_AQUCA|nr:hypothetical protein AQUCO_04500217v1 [Aquilegia coerulea]